MRFHFVINPAAGRGLAVPLGDAVIGSLRAEGAEATSYVTKAAGDGAAHVRDLGEEACDRLVVIGGDGTLREVVNARGGPPPWPVGIVPMGTANVVGRELRMPLDRRAPRVAKALMSGEAWPVDVLKLTRADGTVEHAVANTGIGLDAEVVHAVSEVRAGGVGGYAKWIRPILESFSTFEFPKLRVTIDDHVTYAAGACVVQNARNYGGVFALSPKASLDSGFMDVMIVRSRTNRSLFGILLSMLLRRTPHNHDVKIVPSRSVRLRSDRASRVQADGDPAGYTDLRVDLIPQGLTLLRAPA